MNKSIIEYCEYLYNRLKDKLLEAKEYELYMYVICSVRFGLRKADVLKLEYKQFDFYNEMVYDVHLLKLSSSKGYEVKQDIPIFYRDEIIHGLQLLYKHTNLINLFPTLQRNEIDSKIENITGIINFHGHILRQIGAVLKLKYLGIYEE